MYVLRVPWCAPSPMVSWWDMTNFVTSGAGTTILVDAVVNLPVLVMTTLQTRPCWITNSCPWDRTQPWSLSFSGSRPSPRYLMTWLHSLSSFCACLQPSSSSLSMVSATTSGSSLSSEAGPCLVLRLRFLAANMEIGVKVSSVVKSMRFGGCSVGSLDRASAMALYFPLRWMICKSYSIKVMVHLASLWDGSLFVSIQVRAL